MSEVAQPQPERIRRSTGNRSAESVHRAVAHIADKLLVRAKKISDPTSEAELHKGYHESRIHGELRNRRYGVEDPARKSELHRYEPNLAVGDDGANTLSVSSYPDKDGLVNRVQIFTNGKDTIAEMERAEEGTQGRVTSTLKNPSAVADVAANMLNEVRAGIVDQEIAKKNMIDVVSGKRD